MATHHPSNRGIPGPPPLAEKRALFAKLILEGINNSEACRKVGIHRRTGTRWRYGRKITDRAGRTLHYPAMKTTKATDISARFLSEDERIVIADRCRAGHTLRAIANEMNRSPSTISRELRRNCDLKSGHYRPFSAHKIAAARRMRPRQRKLATDPVLREFVQGLLQKRWSPEQISHELRVHFVDAPSRHLVPETIYQSVYVTGGELRLCPTLRSGRRRRKIRRRRGVPPSGFFSTMTMIDRRPLEANDRDVPGHWEGDLIVGTKNRSAIGTLVERCSRHLILVHLPEARTAEAMSDALIKVIGGLPSRLRQSLTWDQGKEMCRHQDFTVATGIPVFFCERASPWQRGTNENTNGLLRQYFPKGTDLSRHSAERLLEVAAELNARPRKTLGWDTPSERFIKILAAAL